MSQAREPRDMGKGYHGSLVRLVVSGAVGDGGGGAGSQGGRQKQAMPKASTGEQVLVRAVWDFCGFRSISCMHAC